MFLHDKNGVNSIKHQSHTSHAGYSSPVQQASSPASSVPILSVLPLSVSLSLSLVVVVVALLRRFDIDSGGVITL